MDLRLGHQTIFRMCDDHDLCGECMDLHLSEVIHDNSHIFMRLKKPCNRRKSFQKPYLHEVKFDSICVRPQL